MKTPVRTRLLSALMALVMLLSLLPTTVFAADPESVTATKVTSADQLVSGQYVLVANNGYAPTVLDGSWVLSAEVTETEGSVTVDPSLLWTLTVAEDGVILTDSNGVSIAPKGGNNNGIQSGEYKWVVDFADGTFTFAGAGSDTVKLASNVSNGNKFRAYKNGTIDGQAGGYPCYFTLYQVASEPIRESGIVTDLSTLQDGDSVVIFNPANMKALSTEYSGYYNKGTDVTLTDGVLTHAATDVWTLGINDDGTYTFSTEGGQLAMDAAYTSTPLDGINPNWNLNPVDGKEGFFFVENTIRTGYYMQYQSSYGTWSAYNKDNTGDAFQQQLYLVIEDDEDPVDPVDPVVPTGTTYTLTDTLAVGDTVVMYNAASATLLSSTASGYKLAAVAATPADDAITTEDATVAWVVGQDDAGNYTFTQGDKVLGMVQSGSYVNLSTNAADGYTAWTLENSATDKVFYVKNTNMPASSYGSYYVEYYSGYTAYSTSSPSDTAYGISFYKLGSAEPERQSGIVTDLTTLRDGDTVVVFNPANLKSLSATASGTYYRAGVDVTLTDGVLSGYGDAELWTLNIVEGGYTFSTADGQKLSMGAEYTSVPLDEVNTVWEISAAATADCVYIKNVARNAYLEWYASKGNWSSYYSIGSNEALFAQQLYLVVGDGETGGEDPVDPVEPGDTGKITSADQLTSGYYVMVVSSGYAPSVLEGNWVLCAQPTISGDKVTDAKGAVWTLNVTDNTVTLTDSNGTPIAPKGGNNNGIQSGSYSWQWTFDASAQTFRFLGTGEDTVTLASNNNMDATYGGFNKFRAYKNATVTSQGYPCDFTLYRVEGLMPDSGLPTEGSQVVIYNQNALGVLAGQNDNTDSPAINNALAEIVDGKAVPENGAVIFTVQRNGDYYRFYNERYGYLCSNGTGNNAFYTQTASDDADWLVRTCSGGVGGYEMESRTAKFNDRYSQWLEYYSDSYKTYSMYNVTDYSIYSFFFYPVADGVKAEQNVVNDPKVVFTSGNTAMKGQDYTLTFYLDDINTIDSKNIRVMDLRGRSFAIEATADGYSALIPAAYLDDDSIVFGVEIRDDDGNTVYSGMLSVTILDEPSIGAVTPTRGTQTGEDKRPVISAELVNVGKNPTVTMTLNGSAVEATVVDNKVTYTPAEDMADGRVNVTVTVTRQDGKSASYTWYFTVGESRYQLYFGQLHSHTQYSDGSGTLDSALSYVENLPASANVQFVAFTDHSNYFDGSKAGGSANPEQALYDMGLASTASQNLWNAYKSSVAAFNERNAGAMVALAGFEMTWSGGPGHINTFNTPGIVSRNNSTLNNKTDDAGMRAYYALLSQTEGAESISQFNHPGTTFGNFSDFAYWDAVIDSRMFLVEVGNGEGQIGAGGYYPSYEQYIMALDKGWHVAPTNNQDNHKGRWGNANDARDVILTDNFTEEGIYEAIRAMRVYATEDKNLQITYTVNDLQLGSSITEVPEKLNIHVTVNDPDSSDTITKVEVVVNSGKTAYTWDDPAVLATGDLSVELAPEYSYYFIRVTQGDGDLAVTAPVWVGETLKLGISDFACGTSTPVTGEEMTLTTTLFNSESIEATIKSMTYTVNGSQVLVSVTEGLGTIGANGTVAIDQEVSFDTARVYTVTVTVVLEQDGKEYTFTKDITLDVLDASDLVYIGIDASHQNEYVNGNYKDSMGNFGNLAAEYSIRTVQLNTSEELLAACENADGKFKALILTAPSRRNGDALRDPYNTYSDAELNAIKGFNANGGTVILAGWSDHYEAYTGLDAIPVEHHMAAQQNAILAAMGSSLRISDDATYDDVRSAADGVDAWRLYFNTYGENFLTEGVEVDAEHPYDRLYTEVFSHYGGASVYTVDGTIPATVSPVVYGHATTYSKDTDSDGLGGSDVPKYAYADGDERLLVMASEQLEGQGLIVVSGAAFMSNFEVQATVEDNGSEKNYSNYKICENLLRYLNPTKISTIQEVQEQEGEGFKFTVEGVVTSNASGYDASTAFFDCIYIQDATAGINCFPVAGNYKIGDVVRISGTTSSYQGERQLAVTSIEKIGETDPVQPTEVTSSQVNDQSVLGGLVTLKGFVAGYEMADGLVQTVLIRDKDGNIARAFIDGYITTSYDVEGLEIGCEVSATGLASYDNTFILADGTEMPARIRIRDRHDVVCTAHTHDTELVNAKPATCTEDGYTGDEVCKTCGEIVTPGTVIPATGHDPELRDAKEATCTEDGYTGDIYCKTCDELLAEGEVIPATGHDYKDGTCANCGAKEPGVKTGDTSNITLWIAVMASVAVLAAAVVILPRKKRS